MQLLGSFLCNGPGTRAILEQRPWIGAAGIPQCLSLFTLVCPSEECDWGGEAALLLLGQPCKVTAALLVGAGAVGWHRECMGGHLGLVTHSGSLFCCILLLKTFRFLGTNAEVLNEL